MRPWFSMQAKCSRMIAILLLLATACEPQQALVDRAVVRDEFPLIRFHGIDRPDTDSVAFRGKVLVVNVWATWCPPCRKEMPSLEWLHAQLDPARAAVIGLSVENDDHQVREWLRQTNITFANYLDTGAPRARERLQITSYPQTFFVGPDGRLIARLEGARDWRDPKWMQLINEAYGAKSKVAIAQK
jgi:thiol-disulfide isomerase/thioredoxin